MDNRISSHWGGLLDHPLKCFLAGLKNMVGGELKGYTQLLREARQ
ncbi:MAG: YbjQ family protein, partial [Merismopedia sp. SIO2A8]|nr:YbjQ family protein [Merismopedia sp. SIO2A8]